MKLSRPGAVTARTWTAATDPVVTSDTAHGYSVGDIWVNTTTKVAYELVDATASAAVWQPLSASPHLGFVSGRSYPANFPIATTTLVLTENRLYFIPFSAPIGVTIDQVRFTITTGAGASQNEVRTGIYKNTLGRPGALLIDNGRTVIGTATGDTGVSCSKVLLPGFAWLAIISNRAPSGSATQPTLRAIANATTVPLVAMLGGANGIDVNNIGTTSVTHDETVSDWTTYALPSTATYTLTDGQTFPLMGIRVA